MIRWGREVVSKALVKLVLMGTSFFFLFEVINYVVPTML